MPGGTYVDEGSSPLTRGKLRAQDGSTHHLGLIPAHAGKTIDLAQTVTLIGAHPRSCGENVDQFAATPVKMGSSPVTRGKRYRRWPGVRRLRLIPAHAGKTSCASARPQRSRAHPRSRGENRPVPTRPDPRVGSSPLMRGKRLKALPVDRRAGLIPAHAGKPSSGSRRASGGRAHPHSCGENWLDNTKPIAVAGSSPLMHGRSTLGENRHRRVSDPNPGSQQQHQQRCRWDVGDSVTVSDSDRVRVTIDRAPLDVEERQPVSNTDQILRVWRLRPGDRSHGRAKVIKPQP